MKLRILRMLLSFALLAIGVTSASAAASAPASASSSCYSWGRSLSQGATGSDVAQLQIRVAGWSGYNNVIAIDGVFGPATKAAVERFQAAYGLGVDGIAGPQTYGEIYALQKSDCTPLHFSYGELNQCNSTWSGGAVSAATAQSNAFRIMWKLEALRHALGDHPITVTSGFRSYGCNSADGGVSDSRHLYGDAADLVPSANSLCTLAREARYHGFSQIFGPGFPNHDTHVHVDYAPSHDWSAPTCGI
ncbi:D-Ala-D-Ala carboxypeptidase family metallohydrolase [Catenulispora yoronensis]